MTEPVASKDGSSIPEHNPETCKTPGHIVIRDKQGTLYCGSGGYWPELNQGVVLIYSGGSPAGHIQGELIRVNNPIEQSSPPDIIS